MPLSGWMLGPARAFSIWMTRPCRSTFRRRQVHLRRLDERDEFEIDAPQAAVSLLRTFKSENEFHIWHSSPGQERPRSGKPSAKSSECRQSGTSGAGCVLRAPGKTEVRAR